MSKPRKRKRKAHLTTGEKVMLSYSKRRHKIGVSLTNYIDRAIAAHTRKVCKPLVEALEDIAQPDDWLELWYHKRARAALARHTKGNA